MKWLLSFLLVSLQVHAEPLACVDLFHSTLFSSATTLKSIELVPESLPTDTSSDEFKAKLADLLSMWDSAIFHEDKKDPLKKRPLGFARMISETESVEFEYQADTRAGLDVYRLAKVRYFKPNGQDLTLSKEPLADDGTQLRRTYFSLIKENGEIKTVETSDIAAKPAAKDLGIEGHDPVEALRKALPSLSKADRVLIENAAVHQVKMPLTLDGPMLESLKWWLARMPHLHHTEIKDAAAAGATTRLFWFSSARKSVIFWAKNSQKQITKVVFWVAVIAGVGNLPGMNAILSFVPMHSKIERILHPHNNNIEMAQREVVKTVLTQTKKKSAEISRSFTEARDRIKSTMNSNANDDVLSIAPVISKLSSAERSLGGTPVFYSESLHDVSVETNSAAIVKKYVQGFEKSYILASFKKQNVVLLIPVIEDTEARETSVTVLKYSSATQPETYSALDSLLSKKIASARSHVKTVDPAEALAF